MPPSDGVTGEHRSPLVVSGIFDGEHRFLIEEAGPGRVRFVQSERFGGILRSLGA